jgi:peptidoglycan/LPS O-acetylase OafA/YrhL
MFRDDPRFYNPATWLVCGPLLLLAGIATWRSRNNPRRVFLVLAAISALSMLPVYHRQYDAKLLLLSVPACAMLWAEGGLIGWIAVLLNSAAFVCTGDLSWAVFLGLLSTLHPQSGLGEALRADAQVFPTPLILLAMSIFYLWVCMRRESGARSESLTPAS